MERFSRGGRYLAIPPIGQKPSFTAKPSVLADASPSRGVWPDLHALRALNDERSVLALWRGASKPRAQWMQTLAGADTVNTVPHIAGTLGQRSTSAS